MSDYRNSDFDPFDPNDPYRRGGNPDLRPASNVATGWVVAAVFVVAILAVVFALAHRPGQLGTNTASNDVTAPAAPPATTHLAPPAAPQSTPSPQTTPQPPMSPMRPAPGQSGSGQQ